MSPLIICCVADQVTIGSPPNSALSLSRHWSRTSPVVYPRCSSGGWPENSWRDQRLPVKVCTNHHTPLKDIETKNFIID